MREEKGRGLLMGSVPDHALLSLLDLDFLSGRSELAPVQQDLSIWSGTPFGSVSFPVSLHHYSWWPASLFIIVSCSEPSLDNRETILHSEIQVWKKAKAGCNSLPEHSIEGMLGS